MISKAILEQYQNVYTINAMKQIAAGTDYLDFINCFPGIEEQSKNPRLQYTYHILAANLAKKEHRDNEYREHAQQAKYLKSEFV